MEYLGFAGTIPEGNYGAGEVRIADTGTYTPVSWTPEKIEFILEGKILRGKFVMVRFKKAGTKEWILVRPKAE